MADKEKRGFFEDEIVGVECQKAFHQLLVSAQKKVVSKYLTPQNTQRIRHGGDCRHPGLPNAIEGGVQEHSTMVEVRFEDIVKHDLGVIERVVQQFSNDMERQFLGMMFATVGAACDQTGNTVDAASAGSTEEAFAQMLEKIEFSADKEGNVSLPEIHTCPEAFARLSEALGNAPQSFHQRIEEIKARKIADALKREEERKARFARYGDEA
jgi:hypothetical protein